MFSNSRNCFVKKLNLLISSGLIFVNSITLSYISQTCSESLMSLLDRSFMRLKSFEYFWLKVSSLKLCSIRVFELSKLFKISRQYLTGIPKNSVRMTRMSNSVRFSLRLVLSFKMVNAACTIRFCTSFSLPEINIKSAFISSCSENLSISSITGVIMAISLGLIFAFCSSSIF